jgi:glutamate formiminotransferase
MSSYSTAVTAVFEAVANFSEGRDPSLIAALGSGESVLDVHADRDHHRSVATLVACEAAGLVDDLMRLVGLVAARVDLAAHRGLHPRVGVADVLPIVPLGTATMAEAVEAARLLGMRIWQELGVPVYFYGAAANGRRLADIRRGGLMPDLGAQGHRSAGFCCVGARPPLVAYNLSFALNRSLVRGVATAMRRLPGVQALTFPLPDGSTQLSMNLTDVGSVGAEEAYTEATRLAGADAEPELVGLCPALAAGPGCRGGLLEGRLAGLAAGRAAGRARARRTDELTRLAERLEAQADALPQLDATPEAALDGAERVAAVRRVLGAAGLDDACLSAMLGVAVAGLRAAVIGKVAERFGDRVRLLDRWLQEA